MSGDSRILSLEAWKALALKGAAPQEAGVCKPFVLDEVKAVEGDERALRIRITTAAVDRDGDTISPTGWKLTNYRKNPVVLYGHDYRGLPIARNTKIEPDEGGIVGTPHFVEPEIYPLAETVLQMLKRRYLNAASVGFLPYEWTRSEDDARKPRQGVDFSKQELLEYSIVPCPATPKRWWKPGPWVSTSPRSRNGPSGSWTTITRTAASTCRAGSWRRWCGWWIPGPSCRSRACATWRLSWCRWMPTVRPRPFWKPPRNERPRRCRPTSVAARPAKARPGAGPASRTSPTRVGAT